MSQHEVVVVLDFGGQYNQLIARRIRDLNVFSELLPHTVTASELAGRNVKGIVFSGGPNSVFAEGAPQVDRSIFELGVPILGICYGMQLMAKHFQARVERGKPENTGGPCCRSQRGIALCTPINQPVSRCG